MNTTEQPYVKKNITTTVLLKKKTFKRSHQTRISIVKPTS